MNKKVLSFLFITIFTVSICLPIITILSDSSDDVNLFLNITEEENTEKEFKIIDLDLVKNQSFTSKTFILSGSKLIDAYVFKASSYSTEPNLPPPERVFF